METSGIVFGLTAALCWGVADICARGASRAGGTFVTLLIVQPVGILALLAFGVPTGLLRLSSHPLSLALLAAAVNILIMTGAGFLYRAFAIGQIALVSPIAASFAALTALLSLLSGERPAPLTLLGIALTLVGVIVASAVPGAQSDQVGNEPEILAVATHAGSRGWHPPRGLVEALAAMLTFGVGYWLLRFLSPQLGGITVAFIGKAADFVVLGALALILAARRMFAATPVAASQQHQLVAAVSAQSPTTRPTNMLTHHDARSPLDIRLSRAFWLLVIPTGLLDTLANVAYNVGVSVALTSVVVVLSSLFSAVTVLLAWIFLRERLAVWQWAGVAAILVGVVLVNF